MCISAMSNEASEKTHAVFPGDFQRKDKRKIGLGSTIEAQSAGLEPALDSEPTTAGTSPSNCSDKRRRVTISKEVLVCYFQEVQQQDENMIPEAQNSPRDVDFETEETKDNDGPSAEALILDELVNAMILKNESSAICPILKRMILKGSTTIFTRVRERITLTINRIKDAGKVSLLPSNTVLGPASIQILQFLDESVKRSVSLIDSFSKDKQDSLQPTTIRSLHDDPGTKV